MICLIPQELSRQTRGRSSFSGAYMCWPSLHAHTKHHVSGASDKSALLLLDALCLCYTECAASGSAASDASMGLSPREQHLPFLLTKKQTWAKVPTDPPQLVCGPVAVAVESDTRKLGQRILGFLHTASELRNGIYIYTTTRTRAELASLSSLPSYIAAHQAKATVKCRPRWWCEGHLKAHRKSSTEYLFCPLRSFCTSGTTCPRPFLPGKVQALTSKFRPLHSNKK